MIPYNTDRLVLYGVVDDLMTGRAQIIEIAIQEITAHGIAGAGLNQIIRASGLSKGAFYHHFRSREALLSAVVDEYLAVELTKVWHKPLARTGAGWTEFRRVCLSQIADCAEGKGVSALFCVFLQDFSGLDMINRERFQEVQRSWNKKIERIFRMAAQAGEIKALQAERSAPWLLLGVLAAALTVSRQPESNFLKKDIARSWLNLLEKPV